MGANELELFATQQLIDEILRRSTFQGVIVHAVNGAKDREWNGERIFSVAHNSNLDTAETARLLDTISHHISTRE